MICHIPELGDEGPIVDGLAEVKITKKYSGPLSFQVWEIRPHVRMISQGKLDANISTWSVDPSCTLKISLAPHLLKG
jgi:hypothetical protein